MIIIDKKEVAGIPLLEIVKNDLLHQPLPTVFFFHGFTSAKEHNLHYAYLLAEKDIRVVLPEANYHGERKQTESIEEISLHFWDIILQNIQELEQLKDDYVQRNLTLNDHIGISGTSMGGITMLGALAAYDWIKAGVCLMGNPSYQAFAQSLVNQLKEQGLRIPFSDIELEKEFAKLAPYDLSQQPEKLNHRPLLFWHGKKDPVVPYTYAYQFYQEVKQQYTEHPEQIQFILDETAGHKVSRKGLLALAEWFETYLN